MNLGRTHALAKNPGADTLLEMPPEPSPSPGQAKVFREECLSHVDALYGAALRMTANRQENGYVRARGAS